ncbi:NUDIX hydrolase [Streptomyces sp. MRC013]|uniref:NUDIX hydrolase n=1 Tax=Streptomyces sp. MRC013 TaxID=2898276 RepID=UPI0020262058|nr:NUDIX hydrolase [Streptomyces sp. MRC013]URM92472.1 NUDIX hydrolase [Streptomyces sp. MRC013]
MRFTQCPPPDLTPWERGGIDRLWTETRALNPAAFDGPLVVALGTDRVGPGPSAVRWATMTYRYRALRRLRPAGQVPGSLFVTALVPTGSGLVIGRGSPVTAAPGRWTLPGGTAEPPPAGEPLDTEVLRRHAARELAEETGVRLDAERLRLRGVTRGRRFGSLGFHLLAPVTPSARVRHLHAGSCPVGGGTVPELDGIALVPAAGRAIAPGPSADHLAQTVDRYFTR